MGWPQDMTRMPELPDVQDVAREYHAQWVSRKMRHGKLSVRSLQGEELLVPFEKLSKPQQELDILLVQMIYTAIQAAVIANAVAGVNGDVADNNN